MKYEQIRDLSKEQFRRLTGIKTETFTRMVAILR
ncbi:MAG: IS5/IS1182 family transposase, partial [Holosporales bacterium]|nr:IS5/IS1182 family transposase [Holosporales bacterium]